MSRKPSRNARSERSASRIPIGRFGFAGALILAGGLALWRHAPPTTPAVAPEKAPPVALLVPPSPPSTGEAAPPPLTPALADEIDGWFVRAFKPCWSPPHKAPGGDSYLPRVRVAFKADGTFASAPRLVNPPYDPDWRPFAEAALKAVKSCGPLRIPAKYAPYYERWKTQTLFFDPTNS